MTREELMEALEKNGFSATHKNANVFAFTHPNLDATLYVKRNVSKASEKISRLLVIHPKFESEVGNIRTLAGVKLGARAQDDASLLYYHNTALRGFPKRQHTGKTQISYGIDVNLDTEHSLNSLCQLLFPELKNAKPAVNGDATLLGGAAPTINPAPADAPVEPAYASLEARAAIFSHVEIRKEQPLFRRLVFLACLGRCVISGCDIAEVLDAAHKKEKNWRDGDNGTDDGYLLRKDLHALYDCDLLRITDRGVVELSDEIADHEHYRQFVGVKVCG